MAIEVVLPRLNSYNFSALVSEINKGKELHGYSIAQSLTMMGFYLTPPSIRQKFKNLLVKGGVPPSMLHVEKLGVSVDYIKQFKLPSGDVIQKNCYEQLIYTVLPQLLHWEDRNSMANSLESRVPFLDFRFVEFNLSLLPDMKIADGYTKQILREAMFSILPEKIRMRTDKIGFATAEEYWMAGQSSKRLS